MFCVSTTKKRKYDNVRVYSTKNISQSGAQLCLPVTGCNNELQSFAKLSYSAIDNALTSLLPAGLQNFVQVLNISNTTMTVVKLLECPQMEQSTGFKSGLFILNAHFFSVVLFVYALR